MPDGFGERPAKPLAGSSAFRRHAQEAAEPVRAKLKLGPGGRVVIPAAIRERLGLNEGDALMATFEAGELKLISLAESVRRAQAVVRELVPPGQSLVDELLAERRADALKDSHGG